MGKIFNHDLFRERLKEVVEEHGDSIRSLASDIGIAHSTILRYMNGQFPPKSIVIEAIAKRYNVDPAWIMGAEDVEKYFPEEAFQKVPVIGVIAAGLPILAQENIEGYEYINREEGVDFCLKVKGNSMIGARIYNGDTVFIRQQADVESGEIAAVQIDGEVATLKRVFKVNGNIILHAENPEYTDMIFSKKDKINIRILGKAISFKSCIK